MTISMTFDPKDADKIPVTFDTFATDEDRREFIEDPTISDALLRKYANDLKDADIETEGVPIGAQRRRERLERRRNARRRRAGLRNWVLR